MDGLPSYNGPPLHQRDPPLAGSGGHWLVDGLVGENVNASALQMTCSQRSPIAIGQFSVFGNSVPPTPLLLFVMAPRRKPGAPAGVPDWSKWRLNQKELLMVSSFPIPADLSH